MRVTNRMIVDNSISNMTGSMDKLYELQKKAATGKKYLNASDNPSNAASVFTLKSTLQVSEVYETTAQNTMDWMEASDFAMQHAHNLGQKAVSLVLRGLSDTMGPEGRKAMAAEVDGLLKEAIDVANTKHLDRYIFSGFTTNIVPFTTTNTDPLNPGRITSVLFKDGLPQTFQPIHREVGPGETVTANIDGKATFENFLNSLIAIRDALDSNDVVTLRSESTNLNSGINEINLASTINGSRMRTIEAARERIEKSNIEFKALLSQKEEINMAEIVALLRNQENIYETVVSIASRTQSMMNLFESLR